MPAENSPFRHSTPPYERLKADFEREWQCGREPDLESLLKDVPVDARSHLVAALLRIELHWRHHHGLPLTFAQLAERFSAGRDSTAEEIAAVVNAPAALTRAQYDELVSTETKLTSGFDCHIQPPVTFKITPRGLVERLERCPTFSGLPEELLETIADCLEEGRFQEGELVLRQGEPGASLMIVQEGLVEIVLTDAQGRNCTISRIGPQQVLGEMSLLTQEPATASAVALSPTHVLILPAEAFHELAAREPRLRIVLTNLVAARLGGPNGDVLSGKELMGFQIVRRLAAGGMSVVYEAIRLQDRLRVALKMMSHRLVYDERSLQLFQKEASLTEAFDHPHIVRMFQRFQAFHTYFIAMEYCDGEDLRSLIARRGPLDIALATRILAQISEAVSYSHRAGVIHRDIKPSNIMVTAKLSAVLVDFGLAKPSLDTALYLQGCIAGTPQYMAPEQLAGANVTERADYFSLGCVAYEMLTGRRLISESTLDQIRRRHREWVVPRLAEECPWVNRDLAMMIERCLAKNPAERIVDLDQLAVTASQA
jgi:CRP-like cAMP-binding protein